MILHIFNDQKKFSVGYFKFLKDQGMSFDDTLVYHYGKKSEVFDEIGVTVHFLKNWFMPQGHLKLYRDMLKADKIIIHSLASPYLLWFLFTNQKLCKKVYWIVWGKDLYFYHLAKHKTPLHFMYEAFRKPVLRKIAHVVTILEEEYDLVKEWYHNEGENIVCHMLYPYCVKLDGRGDTMPEAKEKNDKICVLLGNSASKTNEHIDAIDILSRKKDELLKVYCPLSYGGSKKYAKKVQKYGLDKMPDTFRPLMDFMPLDEYERIWEETDIAVFNQRRQEALGNIYSLIMQRKTVYLMPDTSMWKFFKRVGIQMGEFHDGAILTTFDQTVLDDNVRILYSFINQGRSIEVWKKILGQ